MSKRYAKVPDKVFAAMTAPRTAAGQQLAARIHLIYGVYIDADVAAIEAEASAGLAALEAIAALPAAPTAEEEVFLIRGIVSAALAAPAPAERVSLADTDPTEAEGMEDWAAPATPPLTVERIRAAVKGNVEDFTDNPQTLLTMFAILDAEAAR